MPVFMPAALIFIPFEIRNLIESHNCWFEKKTKTNMNKFKKKKKKNSTRSRSDWRAEYKNIKWWKVEGSYGS